MILFKNKKKGTHINAGPGISEIPTRGLEPVGDATVLVQETYKYICADQCMIKGVFRKLGALRDHVYVLIHK